MHLVACQRTLSVLGILSVCWNPLLADAPIIDGILDDESWTSAIAITTFLVTSPFSLDVPPRETVVQYLSDDEGIYIGFTNYQPRGESVASTTLRDEAIRADFDEVVIDFDASGDRAFGFKVSRLNSIQDSVWTNQNRENIDWDGNWTHAVYETDDYWSSEIFIPWDVTVSGLSEGDRVIGLYFSRWHEGLKQRYSYPQISPSRQIFLNDFKSFSFQNSRSTSLDFFPYARADQDLVRNEINYKVGIDVFWKPSSNRQFNIAINPDFGQVESNELVVNFSAIETFFSEKRPFFRENHELFDIQGPETLRVIHTPNIGGEPDRGDKASTDIAGAVRFTQIGEKFDIGLLTAIEDDDRDVQGREYFAGRIQYRLGEGKIGFLHSSVGRPEIGRNARTNSIDFEQTLAEEFRFTGQFIHSDISQKQGVTTSGSAWWFTSEWQPEDSISHVLTLLDYGQDLDISDFGFVQRVNRQQLEYEFEKEWSDLGHPALRDATLGFGLEYGTNEQNDSLPTQFETALELVTESTALFEFELEYRSKGIDDLITRGRSPVELPSTFVGGISYESARVGIFSWGVGFDMGKDGLHEPFYEISIEPELQLTEQINVALEVEYVDSNSWVIFLEDNQLGDFDRRELTTILNISAQFGERHQFSLKLESVVLKAKARQKYLALADGTLLVDGSDLSSFSLSEFAFQARYRYELGPLSEIFLVYSRGGEIERDDLNSDFRRLMQHSINNPDEERLLFKIKRQF